MGIGEAAIGVGAGMATSAFNGLLGGMTERRNMRNQKRLMEMQQMNQMELNKQGAELSMDMWNKTNYGAQRKHMEDAGLNVGLMYGMSGGGGVTSNAGSGGSAQGGNAPMAQAPYMDIGSIAQVALLQAQKENIEADTKLKLAGGEGKGLENEITKGSLDEQILGIKAEADKKQSEARTELVNANVSERTKEDQITSIKQKAIQDALQVGVMEQGIKLSEAQIRNMAEQIAINKFNANQSAEFKSLDTVAGSQMNKLINKIYSLFGIEEETETQDKMK